MDADGEDDPSKLRKLVIKAEKNEKGIVFAKELNEQRMSF